MAEERYIARADGCTFPYDPELLKKPGRREVTKAEAEVLEANRAGRRLRAMAEELEQKENPPAPAAKRIHLDMEDPAPAKPVKSAKVKDLSDIAPIKTAQSPDAGF